MDKNLELANKIDNAITANDNKGDFGVIRVYAIKHALDECLLNNNTFYDNLLVGVTVGMLSNEAETLDVFVKGKPKKEALSDFIDVIFEITDKIAERRNAKT